MKVALFYPKNVLASWYTLGGYRLALERLGHEVVDCPLPGNQVANVDHVRARMPTLEKLGEQDVVISAFHEYVQPWLEALYGQDWNKRKFPVIARFDETMDRVDLGLNQRRVDELKRWADLYSFPAAQDADKYGGQWLPFGADVSMFHSRVVEKKYPLGFIGTVYPSRMNYLNQLGQAMTEAKLDVTFQCGRAIIEDLGGLRERETTELLVENYNQIKIFFCLPPVSRLFVCKAFEVMACGTFLMYPKLPGTASKNHSIFQNGEHLAYYEAGFMEDNVKQIKFWLEHDELREKIAKQGRDLVHKKFTLDQMFEKLLSLVPEEKIPIARTAS